MAKSKMELTPRDVQLATAGIAPEMINRELARFARSELAAVIAAGEASTIYTKYVNGREGAEEETVEAPGPIIYDFSYWEPILRFTLAELEKRSPVSQGKGKTLPANQGSYKSSHRIMIGSQFVEPTTQIAAGEDVTVVNTQPYSRKIEVGFMKTSVPDGVYQDVMRMVRSQFGRAITVRFKMIMLPNGYVLKGRFSRGYKPGARSKLAKDTVAGARMTYPSLEMSMR